MTDSDRIAHLEAVVRQLRGEVAELRESVRRLSGQPSDVPEVRSESTAWADRQWSADPVAPAPPPPAPALPSARRPTGSPTAREAPSTDQPTPQRLDLESLIGRYGTIALATLTITVGAGAFLTWAIANGKLGPHVRLVIGAVVAMAVAALGMRLRRRGTPRFGNALLGLALALAHVEAWGAGPSLHIVSSGVALAIAAVASTALAILALRIGEESLFAVGLGGALLAPFVTSEARGDVFVLLGYGLVVIGTGVYVMRPRGWRLASWLMVVGCLAYTLVGLDMAARFHDWAHAFAPAILPLCCAWCAAAWGGARQRRTVVPAYLAIVLLAYLAALAPPASPVAVVLGLPFAATLTAYFVARLSDISTQTRLVAAVGLPLGLFGAALLIAVRDASGLHIPMIAALWTVLACAGAWDADVDARPLHVMVAGIVSGAGLLSALHGHPLILMAVLSAHAVLFASLCRRWPRSTVLVPAAGTLVIAIVIGYVHLRARPAYGYTPFITAPSAAALVVTLACWLAWFELRHVRLHAYARDAIAAGMPAAGLAALITFLWGREELSRAYSPDIAIFLLVLYFAFAGVVSIHVGRRRDLPVARFAGLALAIYAAFKAVLRAWDYGAVGFKVGSCVLAGAFLLAVAYWYRARGEGTVG